MVVACDGEALVASEVAKTGFGESSVETWSVGLELSIAQDSAHDFVSMLFSGHSRDARPEFDFAASWFMNAIQMPAFGKR